MRQSLNTFVFVAIVTCGLLPGIARAAPPQSPPADTAPALDPSDPNGPLLTPGIRPPRRDKAPDLSPETPLDRPDRKADPEFKDKSGPTGPDAKPAPKRADPAPRVRPKPGEPPKGQTEDKAAPGKSAPGKKAATKEAKPGLEVAQPRSAVERDKALANLYALLATAENAEQAHTISESIEHLWVASGSDTINYLMQRALLAANSKNPDLAIKLLDAVVALAPDYAEGWNRRAYVHYSQNHLDLALGDLRRTLALDPNHFKALDGLTHMLQEIGRKKEALSVARKLLDINPFYDGAKQAVDELARDIEERGI